MFGPLLPANAEARGGGWECKSYVCISCQTYIPPFARTVALVQAAGTNGLFRGCSQVVGYSLFAAQSDPLGRS